MPKYNVIHGSLTVAIKDGMPVTANIGDAVELTDAQASGLIASGFLAETEQFGALRQMVESAAKANAISTLDRKHQKLAAALNIRNQAPEAPKSKGK
jgi:hypothetical protein